MIKLRDPATGKEYKSLKAAAKAIGISRYGVKYRLTHNYPPEMVFFPGAIQGTFARDHIGRDFPSVSAMARAWGLSPRLVALRLARGWPVEKALQPPRKWTKQEVKA